jgi:ABC-type bacteriocin/lantibiotic exporter with double-glycine peptidase domain
VSADRNVADRERGREGADIPSLRAAVVYWVRLARLVQPFWGGILRAVTLGALGGVVGMAVPYIGKLLIDQVYPSRDVSLMQVLVGGILAISAVGAVTSGIQAYYSLLVNTSLNNATQLFFFNCIQYLPMRFFERRQVGEIASRFGDVQGALQSLTRVAETVVLQGVYLLFVPMILLFLEWRLALIALISIPATAALAVLSSGGLRRHGMRSAQAYASLTALEVETLAHIRAVKSLVLEADTYRRAVQLARRAMDVEMRVGGIGQIVSTANALLQATNVAVFTWVGWRLILSQQMTLGDFIAFSAYVGYLYGPMVRLIGLFSDFQSSAVHLSRIYDYLDRRGEQDPTTTSETRLPARRRIWGHIELCGVDLSYEPGKTALTNVNLEVTPGSVVAVVGASGSGKTSLFRLLIRLESPNGGRILVDGQPIDGIPLSDLRRQVATVWQEYTLFSGTVWDNLTLGLDAVDHDTVQAATRLVQLHDFICCLPQGYQAQVGEGGQSFSGGQRQRLAVARALLSDAPVLLLDEAMANVDMRMEMEILGNLLTHRRGRTTLFITHRVAPVALADRVCVLARGQVVGFDSHAELLRGCEEYRLLATPGLPTASSAPRGRVGAAQFGGLTEREGSSGE